MKFLLLCQTTLAFLSEVTAANFAAYNYTKEIVPPKKLNWEKMHPRLAKIAPLSEIQLNPHDPLAIVATRLWHHLFTENRIFSVEFKKFPTTTRKPTTLVPTMTKKPLNYENIMIPLMGFENSTTDSSTSAVLYPNGTTAMNVYTMSTTPQVSGIVMQTTTQLPVTNTTRDPTLSSTRPPTPPLLSSIPPLTTTERPSPTVPHPIGINPPGGPTGENPPVCQLLPGRPPVCVFPQGRPPVCQFPLDRPPLCQFPQGGPPVCLFPLGGSPYCQFPIGRPSECQLLPGGLPPCQFGPGSTATCQALPGGSSVCQFPPGGQLVCQFPQQGQQACQYSPERPPTGQLPPGQPPTGQLPPGQPPTGQLPPGQPLTGQLPPGQPPSGQFPPGQLPPGQPPSGQIPSGQLPPGQPSSGQYLPGQPQTGQFSPGHQPTGPLQPGQSPPGQFPAGQPSSGQFFPGQPPTDTSLRVPVDHIPSGTHLTSESLPSHFSIVVIGANYLQNAEQPFSPLSHIYTRLPLTERVFPVNSSIKFSENHFNKVSSLNMTTLPSRVAYLVPIIYQHVVEAMETANNNTST